MVIKKLLRVSFQDIPKLSHRAANVIDICCRRNPDLVKPFIPDIIEKLPDLNNEGVKRNLTNILTRSSFTEDENHIATLINICLNRLTSSEENVALKIYSMSILYNISKRLLELKNQLILVNEEQFHKNTNEFKVNVRRFQKKL